MLFQIFHDVRINYTLCFIGKSIFCSYYFRFYPFRLQNYHFFLTYAKKITFSLLKFAHLIEMYYLCLSKL